MNESESEVAQPCPTLVVTPCTVAYQVPPSVGFSRQEYWSRLPFPSSFPNSKMVAATVIKDDQITVSWGLIFAEHNVKILTQILRFRIPKWLPFKMGSTETIYQMGNWGTQKISTSLMLTLHRSNMARMQPACSPSQFWGLSAAPTSS